MVIALHAVFLHGWPLANGGTPPAVPAVSTMIVRVLTPSPAESKEPVRVAATAGSEATVPPSEPRPAAQSREPHAAAARADVAASRPASVSSRAAPPESEYLAASRLDPGPKLLEDVDPMYPPEAGLTEGSVVLRLLIGRTGAVDQVTVVRAAPSGVFEQAAVAAFSAARFSPGRMLGVPVKSQVTFEVHFTPIDRGANVAAPTY